MDKSNGGHVADRRHTVCVSASMIQEIKRIIKESEIIKYVFLRKPRIRLPLIVDFNQQGR